jgi:hypothetical protein
VSRITTSAGEALGGVEAATRDVDHRRARGSAVDRDVHCLAERLELVGGGRPIGVGGDEERTPSRSDEMAGELGGGRRLARALEADHRDDRRVAGEVERAVAGTEEATSSSWTIFTIC